MVHSERVENLEMVTRRVSLPGEKKKETEAAEGGSINHQSRSYCGAKEETKESRRWVKMYGKQGAGGGGKTSRSREKVEGTLSGSTKSESGEAFGEIPPNKKKVGAAKMRGGVHLGGRDCVHGSLVRKGELSTRAYRGDTHMVETVWC